MSLDQKSEIAENIYFKVIDHLGITDECIKTNGDSTENTDKGRELYYVIEESIKTKEPEKPKTINEYFDECLRKWGGNGQR
jgi:hypothetical protein|tara:strand:+ start:291 stop:533 length:243 start_codon:yes stop_codon:yes gene_type:complete